MFSEQSGFFFQFFLVIVIDVAVIFVIVVVVAVAVVVIALIVVVVEKIVLSPYLCCNEIPCMLFVEKRFYVKKVLERVAVKLER